MKKIKSIGLVLSLVLVLTFSFIGCDNSEGEVTPDDISNEVQELDLDEIPEEDLDVVDPDTPEEPVDQDEADADDANTDDADADNTDTLE